MQMNVGLLIGIYMAICASVLVFNGIYICVDYGREHNKSPRRELNLMRNQMKLLDQIGYLPDKVHHRLRRKLSFMGKMESFNRCMEILMSEQPELTKKFLLCCQKDFQYLAGVYLNKGEIEQAYFARAVESYYQEENPEYDRIKKCLVEMSKSRSVYCRENALRVLYKMGNIEAIRRAYEVMSRNGIVHYGKMLTDGLLNFQGNQEELAKELWKHREGFASEYILATMRFIRMSQDGYGAVFLQLLKDMRQDREIRLEAIRYFRKYHYEPAYSTLLSFVRERDRLDWEYVAMAVLALGNYPGRQTMVVLKSALSAPNWYIRYNAADVLAGQFRVTYLDISDIYNGRDRYAREIMSYMMQRYGLKGGNDND